MTGAESRSSDHASPDPASPAQKEHKFDVFISYSRRDATFARQLQRALDNYTPPADLPVPHRRLRTFRDESDFRGNEYSAALDSILKSSSALLVICSPNSRASAYVGGEIATFADLRGKEHIVTALLAGRPNNEVAVAEHEKAFHEELVARLPVPLAADFREWSGARDRVDRDRFESAWFKLLADIYAGYGVERSSLEGREKARQRRNRQIRTAIVSSVMIVLAALTIWALVSRNEAIRQGNTARSRFLAMQSLSGTHPLDVAMLLAVAAHRTAPTFEAWESLFVAMQRQPGVQRFLYGANAPIEHLAVSPNGTCVAGSMTSRHTAVWNLQTGSHLTTVPGMALPDPTCQSVVVASEAGDLALQSLSDGRRHWSTASQGGAVTTMTLDPEGTSLAVAHAGGRLLIRDLQTGEIRAQRSDPVPAWRYLRFSGDGRTLAAIDDDNIVHRWDAASLGVAATERRCSSESANVFAISADLRWCAAGREGYLVVSDLDAAKDEQIDLGPEWILALGFSPDGRTLMAGVQGGGLQFRALEEIARNRRGAKPTIWSEHRTDVTAAAYSRDGNTLVSAARDHSVIMWNPAASHRLVSETKASAKSGALAANANTSTLALASSAGDVLVSPDGSERGFERVANVGAQVTAIALSPSRDVMLGTADGRVMSVTSGAAPRVFPMPPQKGIVRLTLSPDGTRTAVILQDGSVTVWDLTSGTRMAALPGGAQDAMAFGGARVAFEPGGPRIAFVPGGREAYLWDPGNGSSRLPFQPTSFFNSVAFAVNGTIALGTGMYEEEIVLLDLARSDGPVARLPSHNDGKIAVTALAFSPDGRLLFSGLFDGATTVWDVAGRRRIGDIYSARGTIVDLSYANDASAVTATTDQGLALRWKLDPDVWRDIACAIANRDLSSEERARFLDGGSTAAVCP